MRDRVNGKSGTGKGIKGAMHLSFEKANGAIDRAIDALMEQAGGVKHPEIIREMIIAGLKAGQEGESKADLKLMSSSLKEMCYTPAPRLSPRTERRLGK